MKLKFQFGGGRSEPRPPGNSRIAPTQSGPAATARSAPCLKPRDNNAAGRVGTSRSQISVTSVGEAGVIS
jgi:hypothetical protein